MEGPAYYFAKLTLADYTITKAKILPRLLTWRAAGLHATFIQPAR